MRILRFLIVSLTAVAMPLTALAQHHGYTFTQIANLQDYAGYFEPATLTNRGEVLFAPALLTGGDGEGVYLWRKGKRTTIAAGGQPMPDGGVLGYTLSPVAMNEDGEVAFIMTRNHLDTPPPLGLNAGVYRYRHHTGVVPVMVPGLKGHGGDAFWGSYFVTSINNQGEIVFSGMICTSVLGTVPTVKCLDGSSTWMGMGVYKADAKGRISPVVLPGDVAPGGHQKSYFDLVRRPVINARGDVAFTAHVAGEPCKKADILFCLDSLFVKRGDSGVIERIATSGSASPVHGKNYSSAFGPILNAAGDVAFIADLSDKDDGSEVAVFLYTRGEKIVIAKPGDAMPGGGKFATCGYFTQNASMNNEGDIVFDATLDDGTNAIYLWRHGVVSLVAKTGMDTGAGVISTLDDFSGFVANTQVSINDAGQILFGARFKDGGGAMLVATPH